jgi:hypothetical protein
VTRYVESHGGGTIGVASQSDAASAIVSLRANVAGLGGFSGRESSVTASWLASQLASGHLRWVLLDDSRAMRLPGDTRSGSRRAMDTVATACRAVRITAPSGPATTIYDCAGRSDAILRVARG